MAQRLADRPAGHPFDVVLRPITRRARSGCGRRSWAAFIPLVPDVSSGGRGFYRDRDRVVQIMRHAIALIGAFFNAQRMVWQYLRNAYRV